MIVCRFSGVGGGVTKWGIEQLISNKLVEYESILFFYFFFIFLNGCASFNLKSAQPIFSESAVATKSGIEQQISNKRALNFCVCFIELC